MRSLTYLNSILTVLAVLLVMVLWTMWTATPAGDTLTLTQDAHAAGIPNAGQQRKEILDEVKKVNVQLNEFKSLLKGGEVRVRLEASPNE